MDVQVPIQIDTLNESGLVENMVAAFKDRTIHAFHTEGAGDGLEVLVEFLIVEGGLQERAPA